jgi:AraC-like DNA-binding protein
MKVFQSAPHPALENYIAQYLFLSLENTAELGNLAQVFFPLDLCALAFFSRKLHILHPKKAVDSMVFSVYTGLITSSCNLTFPQNESVDGFIVVFKPSGFSEIFKINNADTTDYFPDFFTIKAKDGPLLYEQIMNTQAVTDKIRIANVYFLNKLPRFDRTAQIREACDEIMRKDGLVNIKSLAHEVNMSLSSFERNFTKKVGVTPKMFARFKRFHHAVSSLNSSKRGTFSQVACDSGYYDQAHFIKEFEAFTGLNPSLFSLKDFPLYNQLILNRNYYTFKK